MSDNIMEDAKAEISGMAKQGVRHPSTKPVLAAAALALGYCLLPCGLKLLAAGLLWTLWIRKETPA